jgi:hypothetical protein
MPSSAEHCGICPLAHLEAADDDVAMSEDMCVKGHLFALAQEERAVSMQVAVPDIELVSTRIFAARACAKLIKEKWCTRFYMLSTRKLDTDKVSIVVVEREEDDGPQPA